MKQRIWELDAARGICVFFMIFLHFLYDIDCLFPAFRIAQNPLFDFMTDWGGVAFFLISGICVTLGHHPVRRGLAVVAAGLLVSAVTAMLVWLGLAGKGMIIYFGVLHCLGVCMLLWPVFRKLPVPVLGLLGGIIIVFGLFLTKHCFSWGTFLFPLGFQFPGFVSSDYFPLFPYLGFFLMGSLLGKTLYRKQATLFPKINTHAPLIRFFTRMGKWSLPIYLLHQPVFAVFLFFMEVLI